MTKQEVISGLKHHAEKCDCTFCPYDKINTEQNISCVRQLIIDVFDLLKKQEDGIEPKINKEEDGYIWYYCGKCGYEVDPSYENYCPTCGNKIKGKKEND